jgi:ribosome maturation factor RimP
LPVSRVETVLAATTYSLRWAFLLESTMFFRGWAEAHFLFVRVTPQASTILERTLSGLGYELVDFAIVGRGKLLRVLIDKAGGVSVDDCAFVSRHLARLFAVEGIDYERLEVSSPGLDRPLKKAGDFVRFVGEKARLKLRVPMAGRVQIVGILRGVRDGVVEVEAEGTRIRVSMENLERARLVPRI